MRAYRQTVRASVNLDNRKQGLAVNINRNSLRTRNRTPTARPIHTEQVIPLERNYFAAPRNIARIYNRISVRIESRQTYRYKPAFCRSLNWYSLRQSYVIFLTYFVAETKSNRFRAPILVDKPSIKRPYLSLQVRVGLSRKYNA